MTLFKHRRPRFYFIIIITSFLLTTAPSALTQEETLLEPSPSPTEEIEGPDDGIYFDDVIVRGRPIFQVGSLGDFSARERAAIINRRINGLLAQTPEPGNITAQNDPARNIATLQLNNRVIMTVTQQDAEDFGLPVEELATQWAGQLNRAIERPAFAIDVGQRLYLTVNNLVRDTIDNLPSFIGALIVFLMTWGVAKATRRLFVLWAEKTESDSNTELLIGRLGYGGVWIIGSVITLGVLGLDFGALLGALGLTSVAIGFSLKDVLSNYISGVILLAARPFRLNDQVVIGNFEGSITQIQLRATTMRTYDGRMVYIPNQEVFGASIINNTASPKRRTSVIVGIDYEANIDRAKEVIREAILAAPRVESEPLPDIFVHELAASTVNIEVRFWVDSQRIGFLEGTSQGAQAIKEALEQANIDMPTEIYTLMVRNPQQLGEAFSTSSRQGNNGHS